MAFNSSKIPGRPIFPKPNVTQILPINQNFTKGATTFGNVFPSLYIHQLFYTAISVGSAPVGGPFTISVEERGILHDAYSPSTTTVHAAPVDGGTFGSGGGRSGYLWRDLETNADVAVQLDLFSKDFAGFTPLPTQYAAISQAWVCARVSGGAVTTGGGNEWLTNCTNGYFFGSFSNGTDSRWILFCIKAGVVTTLAQEYFNETAGAQYSAEGDPRSPHYYRIELAASGPNVTITCKVGTPTLLEGGFVSSKTIFSVTDTTPIVAAGRCGFIMPSRVVSGALAGGAVATGFRIESPVNTLYAYDLFQRRQRRDGDTIAAPTGATGNGYDMRCEWSGDLGSSIGGWMERSDVAGGPFADRMMHDPATNPLGSESAGLEALAGYMIRQRVVDNNTAVHRRIGFRFATHSRNGTAGAAAPAERRFIGIVLFAGTGITLTTYTPQAYLLDISTDDAGAFSGGTARLYRILNSGASVSLIAEATGLTVNVDTDYTLSFEAFVIPDVGGNPLGQVVLQGYLNGTLIVLNVTAAGTSAGITGNGLGTIFDNTSSAIFSGVAEGMRVRGRTGARVCYIDTWENLAVSGGPPSGTNENDQATIAVAGETDNDSGLSFPVQPEWPIDVAYQDPVHEFEFETGYFSRRRSVDRNRRRWRIGITILDNTEKAALLTFWNNIEGIEECFNFTPNLYEGTVKAGFVDHTLPLMLMSPGIWSFEVEVEERFPS